jgi:hypothetical protein
MVAVTIKHYNLYVRSASAQGYKMLQVVASLLLKMLHLKSFTINDVAGVAPFSTSHIVCCPV